MDRNILIDINEVSYPIQNVIVDVTLALVIDFIYLDNKVRDKSKFKVKACVVKYYSLDLNGLG